MTQINARRAERRRKTVKVIAEASEPSFETIQRLASENRQREREITCMIEAKVAQAMRLLKVYPHSRPMIPNLMAQALLLDEPQQSEHETRGHLQGDSEGT